MAKTKISKISDDPSGGGGGGGGNDYEGGFFDIEEDGLSADVLANQLEDINPGKMNNAFYNRLDGTFSFHNDDAIEGTMTLTMANPETEYIVGRIFIGEVADIDMARVPATLRSILNYRHLPFYSRMREAYHQDAKIFDVVELPNNKIINPYSGRAIAVGKRTYRSIYHGMRMFRMNYKQLASFDTIDYAIEEEGACVISWFKLQIKSLTQEKVNEILGEKLETADGLTYPQVFKICEKYNIPVACYDIDGDLIEEQKAKDGKHRKRLDFIISNYHMYVMNKENKKKPKATTVEYEGIDDIDKYNNTTIIVTDKDKFKEIYERINAKYMLTGYNKVSIKYRSNVIRYIDNYETFTALREVLEKKHSRSCSSMIESIFHLRGTMNDQALSVFNNISKIVVRKSAKETIRFDGCKHYPSKLMRHNIEFGIPSIIDNITAYDKRKVLNYGWYWVKLKKYDSILFTQDDWYCGYELNELKADKYEIKYQFIPSSVVVLNGKCQREAMDKIGYKLLTYYIGWLAKCVNVNYTYYNNITEDEREALGDKYDSKLYEHDGIYTRSDESIMTRTGILASLTVRALSNIHNYRFNKQFTKDNKQFKLVSIKTDSLGYLSKVKTDDYIKNDMMGNVPDKYKVEYSNFDVYDKDAKKLRNIKEYTIEPPAYIPVVEKYHEVNEVETLLSENKSFGLFGPAGYGKTYIINNVVRPYLDKHDKKYIITSNTIDNVKAINANMTIQMLFSHKQSLNKLLSNVRKYSYIVIDEMSQATQSIFKYIELIKTYTDVKFILIGDKYQCSSVDSVGRNWLWYNNIIKFVDGNLIKLEYHEKARFSKELNDKLNIILKLYDSHHQLTQYVLKTFTKTNVINKDSLNLCYYHKTIKSIGGKTSYTVHSFQGRTILNDKFTIFDLDKMTPELIYTAISRACNSEQIQIYVK